MDDFERFFAQAQGTQSLPTSPRIAAPYAGQTNDEGELVDPEDVTEELLPRSARDEIARGLNGVGAKPKLTRMVSSPGMVSKSIEVNDLNRSSSVRRQNGTDCNGNSERRPHKRTYSMPVKRRPARSAQQLHPPEVMEGEEEENYEVLRVRTFSTKSGGIINRGDSFKIKSRSKTGSFRRKLASSREGSTDNQSLQSVDEVAGSAPPPANCDLQVHIQDDGQNGQTVSTEVHYRNEPMVSDTPGKDLPTVEITPVTPAINRASSFSTHPATLGSVDTEDTLASDEESDELVYTVLVLGSQGVGKTTLTQQLLTSEYLANSENLPDEDGELKTVSVMLDDEESMVRFIDVEGDETPKNHESVDAYIIIYSVTDRKSFSYAQSCLHSIRGDKRSRHVVILVANKNDIVRNRVVSEEEGKHLATRHKCKSTEVSALLDHMVDELLVGTTRQIRLAHQRAREAEEERAAAESFGCLQRAAWTLFRRLFKRQPAPKSCDNLFSP